VKKIVDINIADPDPGNMVHFGSIIFENDRISYEGLNERFIKSLDFGIIGLSNDGVLYPKDGERFMYALQREFSGSAFRATAVREENLTGE
jgi:hypothetical protein